MNMLVEFTYAGKSNFRRVFAEGVTAAEQAFRERNGLGDEIVAIYRTASATDGKHDESRVVIEWWAGPSWAAPTGDCFRVYDRSSVAQALAEPPRSDARPFGAWVAV